MVTKHAMARMARLNQVGIEVDWDKLDKIARQYTRKTYIRLAKLHRYVYTHDGSYGDTITMIVVNRTVKTIMLSEWIQTWNDGDFVDMTGTLVQKD